VCTERLMSGSSITGRSHSEAIAPHCECPHTTISFTLWVEGERVSGDGTDYGNVKGGQRQTTKISIACQRSSPSPLSSSSRQKTHFKIATANSIAAAVEWCFPSGS